MLTKQGESEPCCTGGTTFRFNLLRFFINVNFVHFILWHCRRLAMSSLMRWFDPSS